MKPNLFSISKEAAFARGFDMKWIHAELEHRMARLYYQLYPTCISFDVTCSVWNTRQVRYNPEPGHIIYVMPTLGSGSKRARLRVHESLKESSAKHNVTNKR